MSENLGDFFSLIGNEKKKKIKEESEKKESEDKDLIGEISLDSLFSSVAEEKRRMRAKKLEEEKKKKDIIGDISLDSLFSSLAEEKKKIKEQEIKKKQDLKNLERDAKVFETFLFSEPKKKEVEDIVEEPVEVIEEIKEPEYIGELETRIKKLKTHTHNSIDRLMKSIAKKYSITPTVLHNEFKDKHNQIPDEWVKQFIQKEEVQEETDPNIQGALDVLGKLIPEEEQFNESETEMARMKREVDQLRKMLYQTIQKVEVQGGGGEVRVEFMDDVDRDSAKVDGRVLQYDATAGIWTGGVGGSGGITRFVDLSDVSVPVNKRALIYDPTTSRVIGTDTFLSYSDLGVLQNLAQSLQSSFNDGDVLSYSSSDGSFIATARSNVGIRTTLIALDDVVGTAATNDVLFFDGTDFSFTTPFEIVDRSDGTNDDNLDYGSF